ncbi:aldose 1-epimerase [Phytobacter sp. V91]|uniref:aldose 1-epimerase n=1 Tax=Phytobacter sp. V91 TaxID=3369425 RepID=UPI003F611AA3
MALFTLQQGPLRLLVSESGGVIEGFWHQDIPLLRPGRQSGVAVESSCFPLVPFGNRVSGNGFQWQGKSYQFSPNVDWDSHYLHGDGWLNLWQLNEKTPSSLSLAYRQCSGVYRYRAQQHFQLSDSALSVTLTVTSESDETLPFGLGWHPYFPLSEDTRIEAPACGYWLEREQWLAGEYQDALPAALDFNHPAPLPRQWVNNGFAGWDGKASIRQPGYGLRMHTEPAAPCYFIFVSDPAFDKGYAFDFFCLEPMSHAPDDHHRPQAGKLVALKPGESLSQTMVLEFVP